MWNPKPCPVAEEEADEGEEEKEEEEEELTRLGPQLLVWAHNSGLEKKSAVAYSIELGLFVSSQSPVCSGVTF